MKENTLVRLAAMTAITTPIVLSPFSSAFASTSSVVDAIVSYTPASQISISEQSLSSENTTTLGTHTPPEETRVTEPQAGVSLSPGEATFASGSDVYSSEDPNRLAQTGASSSLSTLTLGLVMTLAGALYLSRRVYMSDESV